MFVDIVKSQAFFYLGDTWIVIDLPETDMAQAQLIATVEEMLMA